VTDQLVCLLRDKHVSGDVCRYGNKVVCSRRPTVAYIGSQYNQVYSLLSGSNALLQARRKCHRRRSANSY